MDLAQDIYRVTDELPVAERFELSRQMRRSVVSMPSNIAEGAGRGNHGDFARHVDIARSSAKELETQLELCVRLGFTDTSVAEPLFAAIDEINRMAWSLRTRLRARRHRG